MQINPTVRSRILRHQQTTCEKLFWRCLRNRTFRGLKFTRQHPVIIDNLEGKKFFFVLDFYCSEYKLDIEIDGDVHNEQKEYDQRRDKCLEFKKIKVLRFKNEDIVNNIDWVLKEIEKCLKK